MILPALKELLQAPGPQHPNPMRRKAQHLPDAWTHLTTGDNLFKRLQEAVKVGQVGEPMALMALAKEWKIYAENNGDARVKLQWDAVRMLVFCADQAVNNPNPYRDDTYDATALEQAIFTSLMNKPDIISGEDIASAWIWIRTLIGDQSQGFGAQSRSVETPIAGWDKDERVEFIATLSLETMKGGGRIAHHPIDAFTLLANRNKDNKEFLDSMQDAWEAANDLAKKESVKDSFNGRWRLLKDGKPMTKTSGRSASGAAAWGWHCALTGKVYDPRVVVMAEIDCNGMLTYVEGVDAKTRAVAGDKRFDTIVVASTKNKGEIVTTLEGGRKNLVIKEEEPTEENPGKKYYVPLDDGRVIKIVNLDDSDV